MIGIRPITLPFNRRAVTMLLIAVLIACCVLTACRSSNSSSPPASISYPGPLACAGKAAPGLADHLLVGFTGSDATAAKPGFDLRYQYLAGQIPAEVTCSPCSSCNYTGDWWGCWQEDDREPGLFVSRFIATAEQHNLMPMFTYYIILQASGVHEDAAAIMNVANDTTFMTLYFNDFRFFLQRVGNHKAIIHIEPDFWGYAQHVSTNPGAIPAKITAANSTDCASQENSVAGMGRCMIAMVRKYAQNASVGLHASGWGAGYDSILNDDPSVDVAAQGERAADFLLACGAGQSDIIVADISDRDAGYYQSIGDNTWLDAADSTLPNFVQAFTWSRSVARRANKPILWWQVPVGNMRLSDTSYAWKDNRVDYFFSHPDRVAESGAIGMAFGSGATGQTTPETDNGNLVNWTSALKTTGGQPLCP
jgi:hypothetical protein